MLISNRLNPKQIPSFTDGWYSDGENLYLRVLGNSRNWYYRTTINGSRLTIPLGRFPRVTLKDARVEAIRLKYIDKPTVSAKKIKFKDFYPKVADHFIKLKRWKQADRTRQAFESMMERYAVPVIGQKLIQNITKDDVLKVIKPIWTTKPKAASALLQRLSQVFEVAIQLKYRTGDNPAKWSGGLEYSLPPTNKVSPIRHNARVEIGDLPAFVAKVANQNSDLFKCVLFGILTATRKTEFARAKWNEVDFENKVWSVPPERRKDNGTEPFRVPLSTQAVELLKQCPHDTEYVFGKDRYNVVVNAYIKTLKVDFTPHGMRSTFRDWGQENGKDFTLMEKSLCHAVGSAVTQAYQRSDCLEQRRPIMQEWADYCYSAIKSQPNT